MNWAKQTLALLVLANWFACIVHCQCEQARLASNSTDSIQTSFVTPPQAGDGEDCHVCDWVATGGYKTSESGIVVPDLAAVLMPAFIPPLHHELPVSQAHFAEWSTPPPDLPGTFLFVCRTALPVRAPSLVS